MHHPLAKFAFAALLSIGPSSGWASAQVGYDPTATTFRWLDNNGLAFNNSLSALSSSLNYQQNFMQQMFTQQNMAMTNTMLSMQQQAAFDQQLNQDSNRARGRSVIQAGKATTLFKPQPYSPPYADWAKQGSVSIERAKWEYSEQMKIWREAAKRYGANLNDYAQIYALAGVVAFEGYTGQRPTQAAFKALLAMGQNYFLNDPLFQGLTDQQKSTLSVNLFLSGYSVFERQEYGRTGDKTWLERAKKDAALTLGVVWDTDTAGLSDADDFVRMLGKYGANPVPAAARQSQPTPYSNAASKPISTASTGLSLKDAVARVNFKRTATPVLPALMLKQQLGGQNAADLSKLASQLIARARQNMQQDNPAKLPLDNVATGMVYAFAYLYLLGHSAPGSELGQGVTMPSDATLEQFWQRAVYTLAADKSFNALSQVEKQKMAEFCLFIPSFGVVMYEYARQQNNLQAQKMVVQMARDTFQRLFGFSMDSVKLQ